MYRKVDETLRMTDIEATERYPDSYIVMRMDDMESPMGTILYIGDTEDEMYKVMEQMDDSNLCGVLEGVNHQRRYLGGIVISA